MKAACMTKTGVILINLGTPDSPKPGAVYTYLKQFLNDPRVIDLPALVRYFLVNGLIVPTRHRKSAHAYQQIWTEQGSPLLVNTQALQQSVAKRLGEGFQVEIGMRYGNPSIESAVQKLQHCTKIIAIPLFPQYSSAANGSAAEELLRVLGAQWNVPEISVTRDFYDHPKFIQAYAEIIKERLQNKPVDKVIFSYHGLPERHITKSHCVATCSKEAACPKMTDANSFCYRAQCYATTRLIVKELGLTDEQYMVTFQSRLGRTPWIKPYTDIELPKLAKRGIKNIAIVCPSFVADCLETLEEIDIRAREQWHELGGTTFTFIPCINDHPVWAEGVAEMVKTFVLC
jgi:ferrochelatase